MLHDEFVSHFQKQWGWIKWKLGKLKWLETKMIYLLNTISTLNRDFVMIKLFHEFCQDYQQEYKAFQNHGKKPFKVLIHSKNIVTTSGRVFFLNLLNFLHVVEHGTSLNTPCSSKTSFPPSMSTLNLFVVPFLCTYRK